MPRPLIEPLIPADVLDQALAPVRSRLQAVTARLTEQLAEPIAETVRYLITAGGKRLRPALVLLCGAAGPSPNWPALIDTATAVELIHTATLIHDDIIDQSPTRRSQPTFHHRWGTERAVLMGDYLHATAFTLLAGLEHPMVMQTMSDVCRQLCRGELREVEARRRLDLTDAEYMDIIRDKTASLIAGCCRTGAYLGGGLPDTVDRLAAYGTAFGLAFQIIDDCLDLTGDEALMGKAVLADLDKGVLSLPMIYLTQRVSPAERDRLFARLLQAPEPRAADLAALREVAGAAVAQGAIAQASARAEALLHDAQAALAACQLHGLEGVFHQLIEYAMSRRS